MWQKITAENLGDIPVYDFGTWILVRNSRGFYAAVNQITVNTRDNLIRGYSVAPAQEKLLISDETLEWMEISA